MITAALPATEENDPFCLSPLDAAALVHDAPWTRFAVIGDSLSAGTGGPTPGYTTLGWAARVADVLRRVRPDLAYRNLAVDGATTGQTIAEQTNPMIEFAPDLLHLPCGANDIVRRAADFDEIERTMREMYRRAAHTGARLTTFTLSKAYVVPVFPDWDERLCRVNELTRELAAEFDAIVVEMYDHPIGTRSNLLSADRIHFAAGGQAVLAAEFVKALAHRLAHPAAPAIPVQRDCS